MKARKFIKRDRSTAGRATGTLLCKLSLPTIEKEYDLRTQSFSVNPLRTIEKVKSFIQRHLPDNINLQTDASFIVQAEIRASSGGLRRKLLAKWKFGEQIDLVFEKISQEWRKLEFEEDWKYAESEIDI